MPAKHIVIRGKVQGVFYRATARKMAEELALTGWVKNTAEGHIEALITGEAKAVETFINWCWQGPPDAIVSAVEVRDAPEDDFRQFSIIRG